MFLRRIIRQWPIAFLLISFTIGISASCINLNSQIGSARNDVSYTKPIKPIKEAKSVSSSSVPEFHDNGAEDDHPHSAVVVDSKEATIKGTLTLHNAWTRLSKSVKEMDEDHF